MFESRKRLGSNWSGRSRFWMAFRLKKTVLMAGMWYRRISSLRPAPERGKLGDRLDGSFAGEALRQNLLLHPSRWLADEGCEKPKFSEFTPEAVRESLSADHLGNGVSPGGSCKAHNDAAADQDCTSPSRGAVRTKGLEAEVWRELCDEGHLDQAVQALEIMRLQVHISTEMLYRVLKGCMAQKNWAAARRLHALVVKCGYQTNNFLGNHIIRMYSSSGSLVEAQQAFACLPAPDTFVWAAIISAHHEHGEAEQAIKLYEAMQQSSVKPNDFVFAAVLKVCASRGNLTAGKVIHAAVMDSGCESSIFVGSTLVDMYAKCGSLEDARTVFDRLPARNIVTWSALIAGYVQHGHGQEALELCNRMQQDGLGPDKFTFVSILKACAEVGFVQKGKQTHALILEKGLETDMFVGNTLVDMYAKCGSLESARRVFDRLQSRSVVTWGAMIAGYAQNGAGQAALELFESMQEQGLTPSTATFVSALIACGSIGALQAGRQIHDRILKMRLESDVIGCTLVDMYAKCGSLKEARSVFDRLPSKDVVTWGAMISGYAQFGLGRESLQLYEEMQQSGVKPDEIVFASVLKACASLGDAEMGKNIHSHIVDIGFHVDLLVGNSIVDMYAKCGRLKDARNVFDGLPAKNVVTWSAMITGYAQHGCFQETLDLFKSLQQDGMLPANDVILGCVLKACGNLGSIQEGMQIHDEIRKQGLERDAFIGSVLVDMYAKCGRLHEAQAVFDRLPTRDVVTWNALMNGFGRHNCCRTAIQCFQQMLQQGQEPDSATFVCLLNACSHVGLVDEGLQYFQSMETEYGISPTVEHYNCIVDLFGRSGRLDEAEESLQSRPSSFKHDIVGWRTLLSSCKNLGDVDRARRCFDRIVELEPTLAAAYVLMSNAYANAGMWEEVDNIEKRRKGAGALKKPAQAWIEVHSKLHEFTVGDARDDIDSKLKSLNLQLKERGHVPHTELVLKPVTELEKEDALCGHAEKLALAFGLLNTPDGSTLLVSKNLRMCNDCHSGTKVLSKVEGRTIIVRDAHSVHHFHNGLCSCGDNA